MRMIFKSEIFPIILMSLALMLTGCDVSHGVRRTALLEAIPDMQKIESTLRTTPSVESVEYYTDDGQLYPRQLVFEQFGLTSQASWVVLCIEKRKEEPATLKLYRMRINQKLTPEEISQAQALMDVVYAHLLKHISGLPPASSFKEEVY